MPSNKFLLADKSKLLKTKLELLAVKLQGSLDSGQLVTKEEYLFEAIKIIGEFYKDLNEPRVEIKDVRTADLPDPEVYNDLWQQLLDDLITVFTELENIETLTVANFNFITTENNRLTARLKRVSSKLGDYILYAENPSKDAFFFKDSFNDLSKIDTNSALLNETECEIGQAEGIVTLPIDRTKDAVIVVKEAPIINPNSNGVAGNNQEIGVQHNGSLTVLVDNNPDTWFEYERVVTQIADDKKPLILDLTINLGEETVINHMSINPNNFGTKTVIHIDTIETSLDGDVYTSIKDDIPIAGFTTEDEANIFSLAPSTSKFAGQGIYTFTPRKVKYVHVVLRQPEPYVIDTAAGTRLRYAVGIRDINMRAQAYEPAGEIVSTAFNSAEEIRKVLLQSNQNPSQVSELANIKYLISPDDGATWHEIQPKEFTGQSGIVSVPEVLEFNSITTGSIITPVPVNSLRVKAILTRDDEQFSEGSSTLNKTILTKSELHQVPAESPFNMDLEENPVDGTVVVIDPLFGSRGLSRSPYILGHTTDRLDQRKYRLPFTTLPRPVEKVWDAGSSKWFIQPVAASSWQHVEIGGEEWTHADAALSTYGANDKVFVFDPNTGILEFGNGTNGKSPAENEPIVTWFDAERVFPSEAEDAHLAKLEFTTSSNKKDMTIKRFDKITSTTEVLPKKATIIRLKQQNITDTTTIDTVMTGLGFTTKKIFVNGRDELTVSTHWSIDLTNGIIYTFLPTADNQSTSITYSYQPISVVDEDDWEWGTDDFLRDSVSIKEDEWTTLSVEEEAIMVGTGITVIDLAQLSVMKGSLIFNVVSGSSVIPDEDSAFQKEVTFVDGIVELGGSTVQTIEQVPALVSGLNTVTFGEKISTDTEFTVLFSNSAVFVTDVGAGTPNSAGEFAVFRATNEYKVFSDEVVSIPGKVTYFFSNPNFSNNGLYSVDYKLGRIYTQIPLNASWTLKVDYDYTDYRAEYKIARLLDPESYEVDITNNIVTVKDSEILDHLMIPRASLNGGLRYYLINYDYVAQTREDIEALKDFFSPIIKDYALKVLTKGRIF